MIINIGVDIVEIKRIKKILTTSEGFLLKFFTTKELEYINSKKNKYITTAGNFAAKEAVSKALGTGIRGFTLKDIEILRQESGKPYVILYNNAEKLRTKNNIDIIHISITHSNNNAVSVAVAEKL